jgi:predicted RNA-binding Zn-ribbon protein involved in translation (DUF1610 family)
VIDRERNREAVYRWRVNNPRKFRAYRELRSDKRMGLPPLEIERRMRTQGHRCAHCPKPIARSKHTHYRRLGDVLVCPGCWWQARREHSPSTRGTQ